MNQLKILIYTTTKSQFFRKDFDFIRQSLLKATGINEVTFDVKTIYPPQNPLTLKDSNGDVRFAWDWFDQRFVEPVRDEYNVVAFHFTPYYKNKWRLAERINGTYHRDGDNVLDFWFSCYTEKAKNYEFSNATRLILHEFRHGFSKWTGRHDDTHLQDYQLHNLHNSFEVFDFTDWNILKSIHTLLANFLKKYGRKVTTEKAN